MTPRDRMARAEDYVFGLMNEQERERAERDMEVDPEFRECVMVLAGRLRRLHGAKGSAVTPDAAWSEIAERIAGLPQMAKEFSGPPQRHFAPGRQPVGRGLHALGGRRGLVVAIALAAAFALGYLAGRLG